ncbi:unnamed protein product [Brassicogethes aeneus]|uniref:Uncharacterized protein n=1 Tax=Brassicogethes aeneus TaxID=1431903 RepID=A0A9P0FIR4_BRAAE|nr:unnamed protein product [Brassicogethes aeneus]
MKVVLALFALVAVAVAAPPQGGPDKDAVVVKYDNDNIGVDGYNYAYETSNGIAAEETAELKNAGSENESISVRGSYRFIGADGVTYEVTYIADENGFQPTALSAPQGQDKDATIVKSEMENIGIDGFNWAYETSNGISAQETGELKNAGTENESISVKGSYKYVGPDGQTYEVTYIADENGFQPQGAHLLNSA